MDMGIWSIQFPLTIDPHERCAAPGVCEVEAVVVGN
jgi:hypothetical protein